MQLYLKKTLYLLVTSVFLVACKESVEVAPSFYYQYYPLRVGTVLHYQVDSIGYSDADSILFTYYLKDSTESVDALNYTVVRYKQVSSTAIWQEQQVFLKRRTQMHAIEEVDNIAEVKMVFPVRENKSWNAFAFNNISPQQYYFVNAHLPIFLANTNFDSTITVVQQNVSNLIEEQYQIEKYAVGNGLIYKELKKVEKEITTGKITNGFRFTQTLISISR